MIGLFLVSALTLAADCGVERQSVKVLADKLASSISKATVETTIEELVAFEPIPWSEQAPRSAYEQTLYTVEADIVGFKLETDGDFHVVIGDGPQTMIVEFPSSRCTAKSKASKEITRARVDFLKIVGRLPEAKYFELTKPIRVSITGVGFFDRLHGQIGVAPNGFEIHPVMDITLVTPD